MSKQFIWIPRSDWAMAPSLVCSAKPAGRKGLFTIAIAHPNSRAVLYTATIKAKDFIEALEKAKHIKSEQLSHIKTTFEEVKIIMRPKRGKMGLKTKT
jgi:hypothetical protein